MMNKFLRILAACCWPGRKSKTNSENSHHDHDQTQTNLESNDQLLQIGKDLSESAKASLDVELKTVLSQEVGQDQNINQRWIIALNNLKIKMITALNESEDKLFKNNPEFEKDIQLIDDMLLFLEEFLNNVTDLPETEVLEIEDNALEPIENDQMKKRISNVTVYPPMNPKEIKTNEYGAISKEYHTSVNKCEIKSSNADLLNILDYSNNGKFYTEKIFEFQIEKKPKYTTNYNPNYAIVLPKSKTICIAYSNSEIGIHFYPIGHQIIKRCGSLRDMIALPNEEFAVLYHKLDPQSG